MSIPVWKYGWLGGQLYPVGGGGSPRKSVQPNGCVIGPCTPGQAKMPEEWARERAATREAISALTPLRATWLAACSSWIDAAALASCPLRTLDRMYWAWSALVWSRMLLTVVACSSRF